MTDDPNARLEDGDEEGKLSLTIITVSGLQFVLTDNVIDALGKDGIGAEKLREGLIKIREYVSITKKMQELEDGMGENGEGPILQ